ncbi:MAG: phycobilisome linker polypeptide [Cyanobacteria bacterium P01_D01_bin.36]
MTGMNTLGSAGISDYQSRTVTIEVSGVCQQSVLKTGNYTVRVPYSQMSRAMQSINRQGGKVASVQLMGNAPVVAGSAASDDDNADSSEPKDDGGKEKKSSRRKRR